jgi:hypothetical protein
VDEEPTCGRGLAATAGLPSALAAVAAGIARNLEVHTRALDPADPAATQEQHVYECVVRSLRGAVLGLETAAEEMAAAVGLPMGAHDMAAMTTPDVLDAFARLVAAEDDLRRLLEERRAENEQMIAMIRSEVESPDVR